MRNISNSANLSIKLWNSLRSRRTSVYLVYIVTGLYLTSTMGTRTGNIPSEMAELVTKSRKQLMVINYTTISPQSVTA